MPSREPSPTSQTTSTNAQGDYSFSGVPEGTYGAGFGEAPCPNNPNYAGEYYDNQSDINSATPFQVVANQDTHLNVAKLAPAPTGSISGHVTSAIAPHDPLNGACVNVSQGGPPIKSTTTDSTGLYTLSGLPDGNYTVSFSGCMAGSYAGQFFDHVSDQAAATPVSSAAHRTDVDAALVPNGSVAGTVKDAVTEDPVSGTCVLLIKDGNFVAFSPTDANGTYSMPSVAPGNYIVEFSGDCPFGSNDEYVPQWWDHKASQGQATTLTVGPGQSRTGIDADLVEGAAISGKVTTPNGDPLSGICVDAEAADGSGAVSSATSDVDGNYLIEGLPAGDFKVQFSDCDGAAPAYASEYYQDAATFADGTSVTVSGTATTPDIDAQMEISGGISGTVMLNATDPAPNACVGVYRLSTTSVFDLSSQLVSVGFTNNSGVFTIGGLRPGSYHVGFADCAIGGFTGSPSYGLEFFQDSETFAGAQTVVVPSDGTAPVNAQIALGGRISGHVSDANGPVQGICVAAEDPATGDILSAASTAADGSYLLAGVPTGDWAIKYFTDGCPRATASGYITEYHTDRATRADADLVTIHPDDRILGVDETVAKDTTPPDTGITSGPADGSTTADNDPSFSFTSEDGATFECKLDSEAFASCNNPKSYTNLPDGQHTFSVRAKDGAGNVDATPASRTFTIDTTPPDTSITSGPAAGSTIANNHPSFAFSSEPGATFECKLDSESFAACNSPKDYTNLPDGSHTFSVRAVDAVGNADPSEASRTFTIDTTAPDTVIISGPAADLTSADANPVFRFSGDAGATFECSLDGAGFTACESPKAYNGLGSGLHTFSVRAVDAVGNADASPATRAWTIDTASHTTTVQATAPPHGTVTSDPTASGPTPERPVVAAVTTPMGGEVTITASPQSGNPPSGFELLGSQIVITAPDATADDPLRLTFTLDAASLPPDKTIAEIGVLRNGAPAGECPGSAIADPDPCIASRTVLPSGDLEIVVLSSHASTWNLATVETRTNPPPPPSDCTVPKLVGKTLAKAKKALSATTCTLGKVKHKRAKGKKNVVLKQKPKQGTTLPAGSRVALTVSSKR